MSAHVEWSTRSVDETDAFDYWRDMICDAFVQLSARPRSPEPFSGHIAHSDLDTVQLSTVTAGPQQVDRTTSLIARSHEEFVLASIQLDGRGVVQQSGRDAVLDAGSMAFYDSTRPYTLGFDGPFRQLVVQVPKRALTTRLLTDGTAVPLGRDGPARLVSDFFVGLARGAGSGAEMQALAPHAIGLLDFALGIAADGARPNQAAVSRRVRDAVAAAADQPDASVDTVAAACRTSRRTVFRALSEDGTTFTELLRAERVRRAAQLLRTRPDLPVAVVAARSGFAGPAQLHRAFRRELGTTPGEARTITPPGADRHP
ncbi:AraC family transcriptional regulator [Pseudonocardia endophytica]|uniref:AraC-like DNA-binding protein n=1 Tax=Pseudonocardia endophytica TaxID=401976 RepID=A0A4R1IAW8_PSEEN|nr:AraC family transcriptional regulator [Pseudonocardia endophytica]TCK27532.1 AraC-like DNA-binding protein [Pseudonocardia endophytica]